MAGGWYPRWGKRIFDLALAVPLALASLPFFVMVAILVRLFLGSPILFLQQRPGRDGRIFWMVKFRSMTSARDAEGNLLPDDVRLTRFGAFLRMTSLDELPELWNIVKGDMSLVGPRPLLVDYLSWYRGEEHRRHLVRPGITGLAQVNGRNDQTWDQKLAWDVDYVAHPSLLGDCAILFRTVTTVLRREGISVDGHATPPRLDAERARSKRENSS